MGGKLRASKLELNPVEHCNLACASCSHLSPIQAKYVVDPEALRRDLTLLAVHYHTRWVRLVGGEPLLHPDLAAVLDAVRASAVGDKVELVTNGVLLPRLSAANWQRLDRVEVSQYPGKKLTEEQRADCLEVARGHGVKLVFHDFSEFRVSYSEVGTTSAELVSEIYRACDVAHLWRCHTVARGVFYRCPQSYFLARTIPTAGSDDDGVAISDEPGFRMALSRLLSREAPLGACTHCLGTSGTRFPHRQIRRSDFRSPQAQSSELLLDRRYLRPRPVRRAALRVLDRVTR